MCDFIHLVFTWHTLGVEILDYILYKSKNDGKTTPQNGRKNPQNGRKTPQKYANWDFCLVGVLQFVILKPYLKMEGVKIYAFLPFALLMPVVSLNVSHNASMSQYLWY